jgi:hypothetical protein
VAGSPASHHGSTERRQRATRRAPSTGDRSAWRD